MWTDPCHLQGERLSSTRGTGARLDVRLISSCLSSGYKTWRLGNLRRREPDGGEGQVRVRDPYPRPRVCEGSKLTGRAGPSARRQQCARIGPPRRQQSIHTPAGHFHWDCPELTKSPPPFQRLPNFLAQVASGLRQCDRGRGPLRDLERRHGRSGRRLAGPRRRRAVAYGITSSAADTSSSAESSRAAAAASRAASTSSGAGA